MDHPFQSPTVLSFCPGILGLERGLERAIGPIRVLAYCEIEAFICANLVAGMESGILAAAPIWTDAKTFPAHLFPGFVDWIIGGYPCPPFSYAGKRKGEEDPRHLWPYLRNHGETIKPRCGFFFENVAGHLSLGFDQVYKELVEMGYSVEAGIFTAEEVGAPHQRERLFILAISNTASEQDWRLFQSWVQTYVGASGELAYSHNNGHRAGAGRTIEEGSEAESKAYGKERDKVLGQRLWNESWYCCSALVNATIIPQRKQTDETITIPDGREAREKLSIGCFEMVHTGVHHLERVLPQKFDEEGWKGQNEGSARSSNLWPARPGEQQYDWEELRTIESGLGCTINGYNFREDLLRAFGNSVVEQTAELAFITLLHKHLKNRS